MLCFDSLIFNIQYRSIPKAKQWEEWDCTEPSLPARVITYNL